MVLSSEESAAMKGGKGFSVITQRRPLKFIDTVISHAGAALVAWPLPIERCAIPHELLVPLSGAIVTVREAANLDLLNDCPAVGPFLGVS
jgi:hypothetical protein